MVMIVILSSSLSFFLSLSLLFLLFLRRFAFFSVVFSQPPARKRERTERKIPDFKTHFVFVRLVMRAFTPIMQAKNGTNST